MEEQEFEWNRELWEGLLDCVEGVYIIEEDSRTLLYANPFLQRTRKGEQMTGRKCYEVFAGREKPCPFCPSLEEWKNVGEESRPGGRHYAWDCFDPVAKRWVNIKNCLVVSGGIRYRVGNVNLIEDMMGLGCDAVREIGFMNRLIRERDEMKAAMAHEISHDQLTGLLNRNRYMHDLEERYHEDAPIGVLFFDLNNLKKINDNYHHSEGDHLLCRLADAIKTVDAALEETARSRERGGAAGENGENRGCYRIGGDEFLLIWEGCTGEELKRCRAAILEELNRRNQNARFPCSVAIGAAWSSPAGSLERLIAEADVRMYEEKKKMKTFGREETPS